jgi:hypothetical protein
MSAFAKTLASFCDEMAGTFPEQKTAIDRARTVPSATFWKSWHAHLSGLAERDTDMLFGSARQGFLIGAVRLTPVLWSEISANTQAAIWRYLRTLMLEAAMELETEDMPIEDTTLLMSILVEERVSESGSASGEPSTGAAAPPWQALLDRLKGFMGDFGSFADLSGLADFPMPEIPDHLRNGKIARLAEEMARQFTPADFGLDPSIMSSATDNVEDVLRRLADIYQKDPTLLIAGAKRVAEKIKKQVLGGSLNRDELIGEAKEFIALFKDHPLFKEAISKFEDMVGGAAGLSSLFGSGDDGAPSERRRAVQERLRKKLEKRKGSTQSKE